MSGLSLLTPASLSVASGRARSRRSLLAAAVSLVALGGCSKTDAPAASTTAGSAPADADSASARAAFERAAQGRGFVVGQALSARTLLVFFDPQCPHCATLWAAVRPLRDRVRMVWMPVAFVAPTSAPQGAILLAAADSTRAMDEHEASLARGDGGVRAEAATVDAALLAQVKANTALWSALGSGSVPHLLWRAGSDGPYGVHAGGMTTEALSQRLGL